jgi:hypothetical protein
MFEWYSRHSLNLLIAILSFLDHLLGLSKPSSIGTAFEHKRESLSREYDRALSLNKECLSLMQGNLLAILIL